MKNMRAIVGVLALVLLTSAALIVRFIPFSAYQSEPEDNRPVIKAPTTNSWFAHHPMQSPPPTGAAAIGSCGTAQVSFVDIAQQAGINYKWVIEGPRPLDILQTIGNGCALLDYNNDGNLDILLIGSSLALYRGDGRGHFQDVTHAAGLDVFHGHFLGCAVGDYDNDGYDDVYLSGYHAALLLHNDHGRRFCDVTAGSGMKPQPWGTSCAWGDIDGDGKLDLYVADYVRYDPQIGPRQCGRGEYKTTCSPGTYPAVQGVLYHNEGGGRFRDVTAAWKATTVGKTLGVAFGDFNGSGRQSLMLSNDTVPANLLENTGKSFRDIGKESGMAYDGHIQIHAGMGVDWGDYNNDGRPDLTAMAFRGEPKCIYHNLGHELFEEISDSLTLTNYTLPYIAFGVKWLDFDNDGWLDLMIANGSVSENIAAADKNTTYRQPTQLFRNDTGRLFVDMSATSGEDLKRPIVGRGLAVGDFDNDGRMDALVVDSEGRPLLLHNESRNTGRWLLLKLIGTKSNRDGYGAVVTIKAGGLTRTRSCHSDGSYLSSSDKRVHIGLGRAASAFITVNWPSGSVGRYGPIPADRIVTLKEGDRIPH